MEVKIQSPKSDDTFDGFELVKSVTVSNTRSLTSRKEIEVHHEDDIVEIKFEDSSTWIGNATEFQEIFNLTGKRGMDDDGFEVPSALQSSGDRNIVQDLAINVFNFFKKKQSGHCGQCSKRAGAKTGR